MAGVFGGLDTMLVLLPMPLIAGIHFRLMNTRNAGAHAHSYRNVLAIRRSGYDTENTYQSDIHLNSSCDPNRIA
jgi:hypothetical protein